VKKARTTAAAGGGGGGEHDASAERREKESQRQKGDQNGKASALCAPPHLPSSIIHSQAPLFMEIRPPSPHKWMILWMRSLRLYIILFGYR